MSIIYFSLTFTLKMEHITRLSVWGLQTVKRLDTRGPLADGNEHALMMIWAYGLPQTMT